MLHAYPSSTRIAHVDFHGDLIAGPSDWSAERTSTGHFTIHHNIGNEDYLVNVQVLIQPDSPLGAYANVTEEKADYLCYRVIDSSGKDYDRDCQILILTA